VLLAGDYQGNTATGLISYKALTSVFQAGSRGHQDVIGRSGAILLTIEARPALAEMLEANLPTWLDIAHSFGYYDQMHMIHDLSS
jgi:hypothetical protein